MKKQDEDDNKDGDDGEKGSDKGGEEESGLNPVNYELYDVSILQICLFLRRINLIAYPPTAEVGETYEGKVKNIVAFGAFLEILPGVDALLHISEIAHERVEKAEEFLKSGQILEVKVIGKDPRSGKLKISRKALLEKPAKPSND